MKIATQHAEGQGERAGQYVVERFLLGRIALQRADISPRDLQHTVLVEPDLADAAFAREDRAAVPARVTEDLAAG